MVQDPLDSRAAHPSAGAEGPDPRRQAGAPGRGIIPSKVRLPTARLDVVPRPRLLRRLDDARHRVALISAPAGSGKTVLVLDWLRTGARPAAWFSIDALDNDPQRFFAHFAAALRSLGHPDLQPATDLLEAAGRAGGGGPDPGILAALGAGEGRDVIVLDDVHHLDSPSVLDFLDLLVSGLSSGPRLVLLTRVDPPIPLGRLRLSGHLLEIRQRDLRFTSAEAKELFQLLLPMGIDPALVARLEEKTEGWAAGLRMAAAALERVDDPAAAVEAFTGSHELMVDYLLEEALGRQREARQRFLMETSILPRFTADACVAVTRDPDAARHLQAVDEANLFLVSLDPARRWYRYHHLFGELLEFRLRRLFPGRLDELHGRASAWFEGEGDLQEALRQAASMQDPSRLLDLLDRHGYEILARSEFAAFARWLRHVPEPLSQPYPMFLVAVAWFRAQAERAPDLEALLGAVREAVERVGPGYPEARIQETILHLAVLRAYVERVTERFEEAIATSEEVLQRMPSDAPLRGVVAFNLGAVHLRLANMAQAREHMERAFEENLRKDIPYLVLASLGHLGAISAHTEGLSAARQHLESAVAFAEEKGFARLPAFAIVLYQLAQVHYLADETESARACLDRAGKLTEGERESDIHANVLIHRARLATVQGDLDRAQELLTAAAALAHGHNVKPFATTLDVERARLAEARTGRLQTPETAAPSAETGPRWSLLREAEAVLQLQHLLKLGRREEAAALAARLRRESEARGRGVARCVALLGEALAATDAGERWNALEAGLELAARAGYVRPLLDFGAPLRSLLDAARSASSLSPGARSFGVDLLARLPAAPAPLVPPAHDGLPDSFTDREMEILALLATGKSNKALAKELFVSVNTVKTHLKRIYAKLDVSTRTQAVERAGALGLKPPPQR